MGTDIHPFIEVRQPDGSWAPLWEPVPDDWWFDRIYDQDGAEALGIVVAPGEAAFDAARRWAASFSRAEILARWGADSRFIWHWPTPEEDQWDRRFRGRNYSWFSAIAGVRGPGPKPRGLPDDMSPKVAAECADTDGHSHSWALVSEWLADPKLKDFRQIFWLHQHIPDPANTRVVYYFDN